MSNHHVALKTNMKLIRLWIFVFPILCFLYSSPTVASPTDPCNDIGMNSVVFGVPIVWGINAANRY